MEERIKLFLEKRSILWNEGKTIALAWFENDELVISRNANEGCKPTKGLFSLSVLNQA